MSVVALCLLSVASALPSSAGATEPNVQCGNPQVTTDYEGTFQYPPYLVQNDVWQQVGYQQLTACNEHDWTAVANQSGAPATGVKAFPDSQFNWTDWLNCGSQPPLSSLSKLKLSYAEVSPNTGSFDWAVDVFLNNLCGKGLTEVMVLNQWANVDFPPSKSVTVDHVAYLYYRSGTLVQFRRANQNASGTVNVLRVLRWCVRHGLVKSSDTMQFAAYGAEVLTTGGVDVPFTLTGFSVATA